MKEEKNIKFENLLNKRRSLSKINNSKEKKNVSEDDSQLMDIINNFNESNDYEMLKKM